MSSANTKLHLEPTKGIKNLWWIIRRSNPSKPKRIVRVRGFKTREQARAYLSSKSGKRVTATPSSSTLAGLLEKYGKRRILKISRQLDIEDTRIICGTLDGMSQIELAKLLGVTQPSISHTLRTCCQRIAFLAQRSDYSNKELRQHFEGLKTGHYLDIPIGMMFLETGGQSLVAQRLGVTQGFVRYRICKLVEALIKRAKAQPNSRYPIFAELLSDSMAYSTLQHQIQTR